MQDAADPTPLGMLGSRSAKGTQGQGSPKTPLEPGHEWGGFPAPPGKWGAPLPICSHTVCLGGHPSRPDSAILGRRHKASA